LFFLANLAALEKSEDIDGQVRALSNLKKVQNLVGIRSLVEKLKEKNNSEMYVFYLLCLIFFDLNKSKTPM
jgi:hypothetical protein